MHPRPEIEALSPSPHGGPDLAEARSLGLNPNDILDFSVSANPFGPAPAVKAAFALAPVDRYPDSSSITLREALAGALDVKPENILIGSGSMEIIRLLALAYVSAGDAVLIPEPTFSEYEIAARIMGARIVRCRAGEERRFRFEATDILARIGAYHPKIVFLCNPNNPTGQYWSRTEIESILRSDANTLVALDEAYIAFAEKAWRSLDLLSHRNLLIIRSLTKDHALAGLRIGFAVGNPGVIEILRRVSPPWNVNAPAQHAALAAIPETAYMERCREQIFRARDYLMHALAERGYPIVPTQAHFFLVKVGNARDFRRSLLRRGVMVRDCTSFGLADYIRIAPRTLTECRRLIETIDSLGK